MRKGGENAMVFQKKGVDNLFITTQRKKMEWLKRQVIVLSLVSGKFALTVNLDKASFFEYICISFVAIMPIDYFICFLESVHKCLKWLGAYMFDTWKSWGEYMQYLKGAIVEDYEYSLYSI